MDHFWKNYVVRACHQLRRRALPFLFVTCFLLTSLSPATSYAAPNAAGWTLLQLQLVASGFSQPVNLVSPTDGTDRLFVVEQSGFIYIIQNGIRQTSPFLDISSLVATCGECGLLGLAFPPDFAEEGYFFVNYTSKVDLVPPDTGDDNTANDTVIARFRLTNDPNRADAASQQNILVINQPATNHNGGHIVFGPDNYLYIAMGDGGGGGDTFQNAQNPASLHGKILRIAVGPTGTYTIPANNPFVNNNNYRDEIWATGVRNPWRITFDRVTGDLYVADVGQSNFEEVNYIAANQIAAGGMNFGWPIMEGNECYRSTSCNTTGLTKPVAGYYHVSGNCSITGGNVLRINEPFQTAIYLYGDLCSGRVWGVQRDGNRMVSTELKDFDFGITTFGEDQAGNVYVAAYAQGNIYRFVPADNFNYLPGVSK